MRTIGILDGTYPNNTPFKAVTVSALHVGNLSPVDGGFKSSNWRKPVPTLDAAIEKLRIDAIADRKKKIAALEREIETLTG